MGFRDYLDNHKEDFKNINLEDEVTDFEPVPDGKYEAIILDVKAMQMKDNKWKIRWPLKITGPKHKNRQLSIFNHIEGPYAKYLKINLQVCGFALEDLGELDGILQHLNGIKLNITVKTSDKGYQNTYFNSLIKDKDKKKGAPELEENAPW